MAGWINDYKMDYSPVVNALNSKYKDRAEQRAFNLKLLEAGGNLVGNGIDSFMRNKAVENAKAEALRQAKKKDEALYNAVVSGKMSLESAMSQFSPDFDFGRLNDVKL